MVGGASGNGRALRGRGWPSVLKPPGACWLRHGSEARLPAALGGTTCCRSRNTAAGRCAARREPRDCAGMGSSRGCAAARASRRLQQHARGVPQSEELGTGAQPASAAPVCVAGAAGAPRAGARGGWPGGQEPRGDIGAASGLPSSEVSSRVTQAWPEAGQARKTAVSCVLPDFVKFPTRSHYQLGRRADSV